MSGVSRAVRLCVLSQMRVDDLRRIDGNGFAEAMELSKRLGLVAFVCFNNGRRTIARRFSDTFFFYSVPLRVSNSVIHTMLSYVRGVAETIGLLICITRRHALNLLRAENVVLCGVPAFLVSLSTGIPFGLMLLGSEEGVIRIRYGQNLISGILSQLVRVIKRTLFPRSEFVLAVSSRELMDAKTHGSVRIGSTPVFVDFGRFRGGGVVTVPPRIVRFLYVGRLESEKGLGVLFSAIPHLPSGLPYEVLVVGKGTLLDKVRRIESAHSSIKYLGFFGYSEMPNVYAEAEVFVLPSFTEGTPAVVLEAMACGLPVVASSVGDIPLMIRDGVDGFLVPPGDSSALAQAMGRFLEKPDLVETMGESARLHVRVISGEYLRRHISLYESVLCPRGCRDASHWRDESRNDAFRAKGS